MSLALRYSALDRLGELGARERVADAAIWKADPRFAAEFGLEYPRIPHYFTARWTERLARREARKLQALEQALGT